MPQKAANAGLKAAFLSHRNHAAHATLICCAAPLGYPGESLTLSSRGPTSHRSAQDAVECASEREGHLPLLSLSQNCRTTGILGRMDAWRAWIGPPQGASDRSDHRPLPSPIRDRRNLPQSSTDAVQAPCPSWLACWRVASFGRLVADLRPRLRHILEDGVDNAEAPSLFEGPAHRIFS